MTESNITVKAPTWTRHDVGQWLPCFAPLISVVAVFIIACWTLWPTNSQFMHVFFGFNVRIFKSISTAPSQVSAPPASAPAAPTITGPPAPTGAPVGTPPTVASRVTDPAAASASTSNDKAGYVYIVAEPATVVVNLQAFNASILITSLYFVLCITSALTIFVGLFLFTQSLRSLRTEHDAKYVKVSNLSCWLLVAAFAIPIGYFYLPLQPDDNWRHPTALEAVVADARNSLLHKPSTDTGNLYDEIVESYRSAERFSACVVSVAIGVLGLALGLCLAPVGDAVRLSEQWGRASTLLTYSTVLLVIGTSFLSAFRKWSFSCFDHPDKLLDATLANGVQMESIYCSALLAALFIPAYVILSHRHQQVDHPAQIDDSISKQASVFLTTLTKLTAILSPVLVSDLLRFLPAS